MVDTINPSLPIVGSDVGVWAKKNNDVHSAVISKVNEMAGLITALPETIRDTIGAALLAGSNVNISVNDAADTITISATGGGGGTGGTSATVDGAAVSSLAFSTTVSAADVGALPLPSGTPAAGQTVTVASLNPLKLSWSTPAVAGGGSGSGAALSIVNVRAYNAVGDGSTDDYAAIAAAVQAVATRGSNNSGIVYFPPGIYLTKSKIVVPKNITLVGEGAGASILLYGGTTDSASPFVTFGAAGTINTNGGVRNLQVDSNLKLGVTLLMYGPQEGSVISTCLIRGGTVGGADIRSQGIEGGNNKFLVEGSWIWADGANAMYGLKADDANGPFAIRDTTIVRTGGGAAPAGSAGIVLNGGYQLVQNVNCEQWESHTNLDAWSNYSGSTLSSYGCTYGITRRLTSGADAAVRMVVENLTFDGSTAYIRDLHQGITITSCKRWSNREIDSSAWNGAHLTIGAFHLWVDASNRLRLKPTAPSFDADGIVVGGQA